MKITKYGAIDIGSNAVRLLVANIIEDEDKEPQFKKSSLVRVPIRLGADAFVSGEISEGNIERMIDAMNAFKLIMKVHGVSKYKACATLCGEFVIDTSPFVPLVCVSNVRFMI